MAEATLAGRTLRCLPITPWMALDGLTNSKPFPAAVRRDTHNTVKCTTVWGRDNIIMMTLRRKEDRLVKAGCWTPRKRQAREIKFRRRGIKVRGEETRE